MKAFRTTRTVASLLTAALAALAFGATAALPAAPASAAPAAGGRIVLEGAVNVRDLGGFRTYDGATVKPGKVIRADALSTLTDADVAVLAARKPKSVVDLRTPAEVQFSGADRLPAGVPLVARPVDDTGLFVQMMQIIQSKDPARQQEVLGNGGAERIMAAVYTSFLTAESRAAFGATVRELAATDGPVLYHCTSGKDRTGFLTYVVLRAVGVPEQTARQDTCAPTSSAPPPTRPCAGRSNRPGTWRTRICSSRCRRSATTTSTPRSTRSTSATAVSAVSSPRAWESTARPW